MFDLIALLYFFFIMIIFIFIIINISNFRCRIFQVLHEKRKLDYKFCFYYYQNTLEELNFGVSLYIIIIIII